MTVVQETLVLPGGEPAAFAVVTVSLAGPDGAAFEADDETLVYVEKIRVDEDGFWTIDLTPNDEIVPSGTVWRRTVTAPRSKNRIVADDYFLVPAGGGPYELQTLLVDPPGSLTPTGLAAHVASRGLGSHLPDGPADEGDVPIVGPGNVVGWGPQTGGGGIPQGGPLTADLAVDGFSLVDSIPTGTTEIGPTRTLYYGDDHPGFTITTTGAGPGAVAGVTGSTTYMLPGPTSSTVVVARAVGGSGEGGQLSATHQDGGGGLIIGHTEMRSATVTQGQATVMTDSGLGLEASMGVFVGGETTDVKVNPDEFVVTIDTDAIPARTGALLAGQGGAGGVVRAVWRGTQAEYDAIVTPDPQTIYLTIDTGHIYLGATLLSGDAIPQGGPLTEDLDTGGFYLSASHPGGGSVQVGPDADAGGGGWAAFGSHPAGSFILESLLAGTVRAEWVMQLGFDADVTAMAFASDYGVIWSRENITTEGDLVLGQGGTANVRAVWFGTQAEYDAIVTPDPQTLYITEDP